ncbi:MAG: acetate/propionate family kinase, partial [Actinomycetota bacterium]
MDLALLSNVLVVNAGSSSLKLRLLDGADEVAESADLPEGRAGLDAMKELLDVWPSFAASGHRVVHGGSRFTTSVLVDDTVVGELGSLSALAPLHNPAAVAGIRALRRHRPVCPAVACFDTSFHSTLPDEAAVYGIPWQWTETLGVRRFGFHGLSYAGATRRAAWLLDREVSELKLVICHLGAGASLAAVAAGRSVDTTMGFTPLEGLIMATRSGSVDPGALLWIQEQLGLSPADMADRLDLSSGLLGMSGVSADMREVQSAAEQGQARAKLALAAYTHRVRASIAAMAASMGGVDAIIFTGGVGEASPQIRSLACQGLEFLGVELDEARN